MLAERGVRRAARAGRWVLRLLALALLVSVLRAALHDFCQAWDSPYYHLPFAARFGGVLGPDDYVFSPDNEARFAGFPLLGERIQGLLYRLSGRPEAANLLAFASVPALALYLRARFRVPASVAVLGLLSTNEPVRVGELDYLAVLVPTAPVPVGGGLLYVPSDWVTPAAIGIDGLTSIYVSMGITSKQHLGASR